MIKSIFISILITLLFNGLKDKHIDPNGTYIMDTNDSTYFGEIKVILLDDDKIYLDFFVIKLLGNNIGAFKDTLEYSNEQAIYYVHDDFGSCKIKFQFYNNRIVAKEIADSECQIFEFGAGISGNGTFFKQ